MNPKQSRGFRNRNPGNIDFNPRNNWQGQVGIETTGNPPRFAVFQTHEHGIRALVALLTTYQTRHGLRTVRGIINRWAPGNENNTGAYIDQVCRRTGFGPDQQLDMRLYEHARPLVQAIIHHELGGNPYDGNEIDAGLELYGVVRGGQRPVATIADAARTGTGQGAMLAGGVAAVGGVVAQVASGLQGLDWRVAIALVVAMAAAGIVWVLYGRRRTAPVAEEGSDL
jgi:hypothetical protein